MDVTCRLARFTHVTLAVTEEAIKQCTLPATQSFLPVGEGHDGMDAGGRGRKAVSTI